MATGMERLKRAMGQSNPATESEDEEQKHSGLNRLKAAMAASGTAAPLQSAQGKQVTPTWNVTEDDVRSASEAYDKARAESYSASMALGAALTARGQNPFSDSIPELQTAANDAIARSQAAQAAEREALERFNTLAAQFQRAEEERKYSSLRSNSDYATLSKGDAETARKNPTSAYYQIFHRNDPEKAPEDIYTGLGSALLARDIVNYQKPSYTAGNDLSFVSDDEAGNFFYLWNTQGEKAANEYLDTIRSRLNERRDAEQQKLTEVYTAMEPGKASLESVLQNQLSIAGVVDLTAQNLRRRFGDKLTPIDYNTPAQDFGKTTQRIREAVAEDLEEKYPDATLFGITNLAAFAYQTGMSMADSATQLLLNQLGVPQAVTLSLMAGGAAQQAVYDAKKRGASDGQALAYGYAAGLAEAAFEKISLDNLVDTFVKKSGSTIGEKLTKNWLDGFAKKFAAGLIDVSVQGGVEASEEAFTSIANTITDIMINQDNSELLGNIRELAESGDEQAVKTALSDWAKGILLDAIGGLVSGIGMGSAGAGVNWSLNTAARIGENREYGNIGKLYRPADQDLIREGLQLPEGTAGRNVAEEMLEKLAQGQKVTNADLGRLVLANEATIREMEGGRENATQSETEEENPEWVSLPSVKDTQENSNTAEAKPAVTVSAGPSALERGKGVAYTLASNIDSLKDMRPLKNLTGTEMNDRTLKPSEQIARFFKSIGNLVHRTGFGDVIFGDYGVGGMLNHRPLNRAKMVSLTAAPEVIQNGKLISKTENWKGRGYDSYIFAGPVTIAGSTVYVAAVVNRDQNNRFYMSEAVDSDGNYVRINESPSDSTKTGVTAQGGITGGPDELSSGAASNGPPALADEAVTAPDSQNIAQQQPAVNQEPESFSDAIMQQLTGETGVQNENGGIANAEGERIAGSEPAEPGAEPVTMAESAAEGTEERNDAAPAEPEKLSGMARLEAARNSQTIGSAAENAVGQETDGRETVRFSFRDVPVPTYEQLVAKPNIPVVDIRRTRSGSFAQERESFLNSDRAKQLYAAPVTNRDTGEDVFITPATIRHTFSNLGWEQIELVEHLPEIIESAVLTNAEQSRNAPRDNTTGVYTLFGAARTDTGIQPVKLTVKEYNIGGQDLPANVAEYLGTGLQPETYASVYDGKVLVLEGIEKEGPSSSAGSAEQSAGLYPSGPSSEGPSSSATTDAAHGAAVNHPSEPSDISIKDLLALVNGEAVKYVPQPETSFTGETGQNQNGGMNDGQDQRTGGPEPAFPGNAGADVSDRDGGRISGKRAGVQAGQLAERGWQALPQPQKAAGRNARAKDLGLRKVEAQNLGISSATADSRVTEYPQSEWEPDLRRIADRVQNATGLPVRFFLGTMRISAGGTELPARGVNTGREIFVQADALGVSAEKIATHEAYHAFARQDPGLNGKMLNRIREAFPEDDLRGLAELYLEKEQGIVDLDTADPEELERALAYVQEEICADAYAGINAFQGGADRYMETARAVVQEARKNRQTAEATERRTGPPEERYSTADNEQEDIRYSVAEEEESVPESSAEYGQLRRQGKIKPEKVRKPVAKSKATRAKADLRSNLLGAFSIPAGSRAEMGTMIDAAADQIVRDGKITEEDYRRLFDTLYEAGREFVPAEDYLQDIRQLMSKGRIYVPEKIKHEWGDDWNGIRKQAWGNGIYLTNNEGDAGIDQWWQTLSETYPGLFPEDEYDPRTMLDRMVQLAEEGKGEYKSLEEYAADLEGMGYVSEDEVAINLERQLDWALRTFGEKAKLEIDLRDRTGIKIAQERQRGAELREQAVQRERERGDRRVQAEREHGRELLSNEKAREALRRRKEREYRQETAKRQRERKAILELQQKTLKQLQWMNRNQGKFPQEMKARVKELLEDMDILAVGAADEMHIDRATGKTWKDLRDIYQEAREKDPNWLPSKQLNDIVMRLENRKIADLDIGALQDLYKAAVGLRTELYNRNNVIEDELHRTMQEVYDNSKSEIQEAPGGYKPGARQQYWDNWQLTPMNRMEMMAGWNPNSAWYSMARGLESGERAQRRFKERSAAYLDDFLRDNAKWAARADGQGKDAIWYELEVPELLEYHMGDKPIFGNTVKVYMTPAQKVELYLESKGYDNLRHMTGGRTFADRELYSQGKRREAYAQGKTIRLAPESVKQIVSDLTPEEQELARILEDYYNHYSKQEINRVSNALYGYDRAMEGYYAPIYTNGNYNKSEPGIFDLTAEGVGNLKGRIRGVNPTLNISAFDAFEKSVDRTSRFVGMAIPIRNMNSLMNWRDQSTSMKDVLSHKWGETGEKFVEDLMTELQNGKEGSQDPMEGLVNTILSRYISSVFGFNPSIVLKQFASYPLAATYLGWENMPKWVPGAAQVDTDLISKYSAELAYRLRGYATPETATVKDNPGVFQRKGPLNFLFGGGAITWMDGFTVRTLWTWAENKVSREQPDLELGTEEQVQNGESPFYKAVAKEFEEAVSRSQPMYDAMHRSEIMRKGGLATRTLTLFKTVPQQELNMLRQTMGEAAYYKRIGADKQTQAEARRKAGRAFAGILTGNLMIGVITFLNALVKNGAKAFRNDDGELTPESVMEQLGKQYIKDAAGLTVGGDVAADILAARLFGDKWYGLETPGIEQIEGLIDKLGKTADTMGKLVTDSINLANNGGDWGRYMAENGNTYVKAVEEAGRLIGTYATGLPLDNVKAYLLGAASGISPAIKTAYEDLMSKADKSGLKGLTGAPLEMRVQHILDDRAGGAEEQTTETIAGLYEAGYTGAVPSAVSGSYSVGGESRSMNATEKQIYSGTWRSTVEGTLDDLVGNRDFRTASEADQEKMLKWLYDIAAQEAKAAVWEDYTPEKAVQTAMEMERLGIPLEDWLPIRAELAGFSGSKKKEKTEAYIDGLPYSAAQKDAIYLAAGYKESTIDSTPWHTRKGGSGGEKDRSPVKLERLHNWQAQWRNNGDEEEQIPSQSLPSLSQDEESEEVQSLSLPSPEESEGEDEEELQGLSLPSLEG